MSAPVRNPTEAFQQLEAIMLRQMLQSSGAFRASSTPGAQLRTDLFVETLADAVAKAGGLGIAKMLERQLGGDAAQHKAPPIAMPPLATASGGGPSGLAVGRAGGGIDDLDDPNSEAPLPEDPNAPSIDAYQPQPVIRAHIHLQRPTHDDPTHHPPSAVVPTSIGRALNRYRERVEDMGAGTPSGAGSREKQ